MTHDLDEPYRQLQAVARTFCQENIEPRAAVIDQNNTFPRDLWPKMGALGLHGITIETAYGGTHQGYLAHAVVLEEISRASASVGLSYGAHSNLCMNQIQRYGTEEQRKQYLPKLCSGEHVGALAMSESDAGSDVLSMQLHAQAYNGGYRLNGKKMWITNGPQADILIVYAKTNPAALAQGISAFIVEKGFAGFQASPKLDKLGMRGSETSELVFENCWVPEKDLLGPLHKGARLLMNGLDYERVILAAGPVGIMQACLDLVLPYAHTRQQFGKAIGEFQFIQGKIADMYTALQASRSFLYAAARSCDAGTLTSKEAASVILYTAENATQMALQAIQCLGGNGYLHECPAGRLLRDAKLYEIGAGTSEIRRMLIGRQLLRETARDLLTCPS